MVIKNCTHCCDPPSTTFAPGAPNPYRSFLLSRYRRYEVMPPLHYGRGFSSAGASQVARKAFPWSTGGKWLDPTCFDKQLETSSSSSFLVIKHHKQKPTVTICCLHTSKVFYVEHAYVHTLHRHATCSES